MTGDQLTLASEQEKKNERLKKNGINDIEQIAYRSNMLKSAKIGV